MNKKALISYAKRVLKIEAEAVRRQIGKLNGTFDAAVRLIGDCRGRVAVIGIGKSGLVGRKLAATLSSTGTPSIFIHPVESLHGDLGMLQEGDVILALSYSGQTEEIKRLLPFIRSKGLKIVALTGKLKSPLAREADTVVLVDVVREACPYNITPTASTTAMLAVGDAMAMSLMKLKGFGADDFAKLHPAGALGKRLHLKVKDLMHGGRDNPVIAENRTVKDALYVMTKTKLGATNVVDRAGRLVGFFTDGDLRRSLQKLGPGFLGRPLKGVMTRNPICATPQQMAIDAKRLLQKHKIDNLPVVDPDTRKPVGVLDERDVLEAGLS